MQNESNDEKNSAAKDQVISPWNDDLTLK